MSPSPKKRQARLRAQAKEDLSNYRYTLRALRAEAISDAPSRMLDVLMEQPTGVIDYFTDEENNDLGDEMKPSASRAPGSKIPIPRIPGVPRNLFSDSECLPAFVEGGPSFMTLWPDSNTVDYEPEWSLRDEVDTLVRFFLNAEGKDTQDQRHLSRTSSEMSSDTEGEGSLAYHDVVYEQVSQMLTRVFSYIAMHRAEDAPDKTLYHTPMDWKDLLKVLDMSDILPQRIIQTVNTRMMKSLPSELDADDAENEAELVAWHAPLTRARADVQTLTSASKDKGPTLPADSIEIFLQNAYQRPDSGLIHKSGHSPPREDVSPSEKDAEGNSDEEEPY